MQPINSLKGKKPIIIAGPCSAESREQLLVTCDAIVKGGGVHILRAGIWKPRTRPDTFEGVGEVGLEWLAEAGERASLPTATEVASAKHVEAAVRNGLEIVWLGARTTTNPFLVQEIAEAVAKTDLNVLIKNPMNPDIELWAGAVARMEKCGVPRERIGLIHRGFATSSSWKFRNEPMWHLIPNMQNKFPDMVMLCDPSHMSGCREYLLEISQTAANMNYDGLIIESHICPSQALSDASQQLTPDALKTLLESIDWRVEHSSDEEYVRELALCREQIDQIDNELFELLGKRMQVAERIGRIKKENGVVILQSNRWSSIVERIVSHSAELGLSEDFVRAVLYAIHAESIDHQNRL